MLLIFSWIMTWILCNTCNVCNLVINYKWPNCVNRWRSPNLQKKLPMSSDTRKDLVIFKVYTIFPWRFVKIPYNRNNSYWVMMKMKSKMMTTFFCASDKNIAEFKCSDCSNKICKTCKEVHMTMFLKNHFYCSIIVCLND